MRFQSSMNISVAKCIALPMLVLNTLAILATNAQESPRCQAGPYTSMEIPTSRKQAWEQLEHVITEDFDSWSGGFSRLSMRQVGTLERSGELVGQQAAAIGLISQFMTAKIHKDQGKEPRVTMDALLDGLRSNDAIPNRFTNAMKQISADASTDNQLRLYGPEGIPSPLGIHQAGIGNCYALSAIEAVLRNYGPTYIQKLIQPEGDNRFTVTFPGAENVSVKLTQAELSQGNLDIGNGCWLQVLGVAINRMLEETHQEADTRKGRIKQLQLCQTPLGWLNHGGGQPRVLHWLTGKNYTAISHKTQQWNRGNLNRVLTEAAELRQPLGICTHVHCLSIINWDRQAQVATIMNPWGTNGKYSPGRVDSYIMKDGQFTVTMDQLLHDFTAVCAPTDIATYSQSGAIFKLRSAARGTL